MSIEPISAEAADEYAGMGGVVRRAGFVKQFRGKHPDMLLLDCGDISQGTPYYNFFKGELEVKMMNLMGYDAMNTVSVRPCGARLPDGLPRTALLISPCPFPCAKHSRVPAGG